MIPDESLPARLIDLLGKTQSATALTGAGISQESGLRTFRDAQTGLWAQYRPEDLATPAAFIKDPKLVWDWYALRREQIGAVQPNPGHYALVEMQRRIPRFTLVTQNVDGLHAKAGSQGVIALHGNLQRVKCFSCGATASAWEEPENAVPRCTFCGGLLRPDVVWFREELPKEALQSAARAARGCAVFLSIGTSGLVQPAAALAYAAMHHGSVIIEINTERTPLTAKADFFLHGKSGELLPRLVQATWG